MKTKYVRSETYKKDINIWLTHKNKRNKNKHTRLRHKGAIETTSMKEEQPVMTLGNPFR
jgi:hypothetical protein